MCDSGSAARGFCSGDSTLSTEELRSDFGVLVSTDVPLIIMILE